MKKFNPPQTTRTTGLQKKTSAAGGLALSVFAAVSWGMLSLGQGLPPVPGSTTTEHSAEKNSALEHRLETTPTGAYRIGLKQDTVPNLFQAISVKLPGSVRQGEVLKVQLPEGFFEVMKGYGQGFVRFCGRKVPFFPDQKGSLLALIPVSVFQKPGKYPLVIYDASNKPLETLEVPVNDAHYKTQNVTVSKSTEGLKPLPGEMEAIQTLKDTTSPVRFWSEPFISPTPDCQNSPFGVKRMHNGTSTGDYHKGVDLKSPSGRPIHAISGGHVQIAQMFRLHGGTVGIDHGQGIGSIYIHMSRLNVKQGEAVKKGDTIGYVGSTGFATGPHLHWGMYVNGLPVNPNQWIAPVAKCP